MLQFDIRVTVREVNNDFNRVSDFDYDEFLETIIYDKLETAIEDMQLYADRRRFELTVSDMKVVK